jgi:hypothetical protein
MITMRSKRSVHSMNTGAFPVWLSFVLKLTLNAVQTTRYTLFIGAELLHVRYAECEGK